MILFPAIDLKDGRCVRLVRGAMDSATVFDLEPAAQARAFVEAGCEWLHLVDLNGAVEGKPVGLRDLLAKGPLVVSFYRGVWCPYCNLELQALQEALPEIVARGASLVAISPQTAPNSRK